METEKGKGALAEGSKDVFGNIFHPIATIEDVINVKEAQVEILRTSGSREEPSRMQAKLRKYLKIEEAYRKQKMGIKWFVDEIETLKFSILMLKEEGKSYICHIYVMNMERLYI